MAEGKKASVKKTTAKKSTTGKAAAKKSTTGKAATKKSTTGKAAAQKSTTGKIASKSTRKTVSRSSVKKVESRQSPSEKKVVTKKVEKEKAAPEARTSARTGRLRITQVRSPIGRPQKQKATLRALGLRKIRQSVEHQDTPVIRGMVNTVIHLVLVEELPA